MHQISEDSFNRIAQFKISLLCVFMREREDMNIVIVHFEEYNIDLKQSGFPKDGLNIESIVEKPL